MMDTKNYKLHQCLHCGNTGLMKILHQQKHEQGGPVYDNIGDVVDYELEERYTWTLLSCPVCHKLTLTENYSDVLSQFYFSENSVLYPISSINLEGVPSEVKSAFEAALKVKHIDLQICLLSLRRTLEAICKERGAKGHSLEEMIRDLLNQDVLPKLMSDACWIIRKLGNGAAHADQQTVYLYEVDQTIGFLETMIKYLYTLPLQMAHLKERITKKEHEDTETADS